MFYSVINKNLLFPKINNFKNVLQDAKDFLIKEIQNKDNRYCSNIYIVCTENDTVSSVIFSNPNSILYELTNNGIQKLDIPKEALNQDLLQDIYKFLTNSDEEVEKYLSTERQKYFKTISISEELDNLNISPVDEMIEFTPILNEVVNVKLKEETKPETEIKMSVLDECEEMMKIFEQNNKRKLLVEEQLKTENKKEEELNKKLNEIQQNKIIALSGNYKTYSNIKLISDSPKFEVPELFKEQYNYFSKMSEEDINIINDIKDSNILNNTIFDEKIMKLSEDFNDYLKTLTKKSFEHNWKELEHDINVM
jgi:hypothetical protein